MNLDIDQKIIQSKKIIRTALDKFGTEKLAIAWTGGKDSTLMLWLYCQVCNELSIPIPRCMFIDEGDQFEEIVVFVDRVKKEWNIPLVVVMNTDVSSKAGVVGDIIIVNDLNERNRREIELLDFKDETFPFEPESYLCNHLMKTVVMNKFIEDNELQAVSTAIRWDEQDARSQEEYFSPRHNPNPEHTRVHPILHFKERDIWDAIFKYSVPFCTLYYKGYRSLGVKSNTSKNSDLPAWEQDLENSSERSGRGQDKEEIMSKLRDLGYM
jgi:phosphoadenosine phosphosulfate reductase